MYAFLFIFTIMLTLILNYRTQETNCCCLIHKLTIFFMIQFQSLKSSGPLFLCLLFHNVPNAFYGVTDLDCKQDSLAF